jgi:hypothetical protein
MGTKANALGLGVNHESSLEQIRFAAMHRRANERAQQLAATAAAAAVPEPTAAPPPPRKMMPAFKPKMPGMPKRAVSAAPAPRVVKPRRKLVVSVKAPASLVRRMRRRAPSAAAAAA